jgi:hypothetical protein
MMNRLEFAKGWLLLTAQPWGKWYRSTGQTTTGDEPSPAEIQSEFYYKALATYPADLWFHACQVQATGEHWPSIDMLKQCLRDVAPKIALPTSSTWGPEHSTKDEFGLNLFEVIQTISGIHTMRQLMNVAVHKEQPKQLTALTTRYNEAREFLANQLPTLNDPEMAQILARYPDVVTL